VQPPYEQLDGPVAFRKETAILPAAQAIGQQRVEARAALIGHVARCVRLPATGYHAHLLSEEESQQVLLCKPDGVLRCETLVERPAKA
jgi:hypothetical protein